LEHVITGDDPLDFVEGCDYVVDAVDNVTAKLRMIGHCKKIGVKIISCMGTGNKLHPDRFVIDDIKNTSVCPLAKIMRKECKNKGISGIKVLYSTEQPKVLEPGQRTPASISFVPPVAGYMLAGEVVRDLCGL